MLNKRTLKISRTTQLINKSRAYIIYINDKKVGSINNGETKEFQVNTANCSIYVKIDWCKTKPLILSVSDKAIVILEIGCTIKKRKSYLITSISVLAYALYGLYWAFFKPSKYLYIERK